MKVVILFIVSLCLTCMGRSAELPADQTVRIAHELVGHSYGQTFSDNVLSPTATVTVGSASSNINLTCSDRHKVCRYPEPVSRKSCKHSRPICDMRLLRHLILLEKILI